MVTATSAEAAASSPAPVRVKAPSPKAGYRNQSLLIRSQPIILDLDAFPAPTSPLPVPKIPSSPRYSSPSGSTGILPRRTPPPKSPHEKSSSPMGAMPGSLRPPPRPRSIVSHLALSKPPSESLPPVPVLLHSNDNLYGSSTPTSPTTPSTPSFYSSFSQHHRYDNSLSTSLPSNAIRSSSVGRVHGSFKHRSPRKISNAAATSGNASPVQKEIVHNRGRVESVSSVSSVASSQGRNDLMGNMEDPINKEYMMAPKPETNEDARREPSTTTMSTNNTDILARPVGLVATRFYGIESSMRWREGVDPIQKRFASSNGSWRCQDRFAVFFRPGDQIGPDQVVTKTFWSEAWPYPIETILYGTTSGPLLEDATERGREREQERGPRSEASGGGGRGEGHRSEYNVDHHDQVISRLRTGLRLTSSETQLRSSASFPPAARNRDPRYITSDGVQKIAKVIIPMPDVAIDQMDLVKAPIKVELRIFILEAPLRIHASAFLLGRTVSGTTELYV